MCILVYSGIHYDTIVQSPSEPPHTKADSPPEFDVRIWPSADDYVLGKALELCGKLKERHYFTDTAGMAIRCNECGIIVYGEKQAAVHAQQTNHYDSKSLLGTYTSFSSSFPISLVPPK
jgi:ubiquitin thioesterase OTU1